MGPELWTHGGVYTLLTVAETNGFSEKQQTKNTCNYNYSAIKKGT
jgi:hypothetical protein